MTENDVLKDLKKYKDILEAKVDLNVSANAEIALSKVTKAIEEIQAYRAIGTVEEIQSIKDQLLMVKDMCKDYYEIGTIEEFKALKDKATPKKDNNDGGRCKYCGTYNNFIINKLANPKGHPVIHCWNCGQAIDWQ